METKNRATVFSGLVIDVEQMDVLIGNKGWHTYQIVRHPGGAAVLPLHALELPLFAFANVYHTLPQAVSMKALPGNGSEVREVCLSSLLQHAEPDALREAGTVATLLVEVVGRYPPGTGVRLSTGELAVVLYTHQDVRWLDRPVVRVIRGPDGGERRGPVIDLAVPPEPGMPTLQVIRVEAVAAKDSPLVPVLQELELW